MGLKLSPERHGESGPGISGLGSVEIASTAAGRPITIHLGADRHVGFALGTGSRKFVGAEAEQWADAPRCDVRGLDKHSRPKTTGQRNWARVDGQDVIKGRRHGDRRMNGYVVARDASAAFPPGVGGHSSRRSARLNGPPRPRTGNILQVLRRAGIPGDFGPDPRPHPSVLSTRPIANAYRRVAFGVVSLFPLGCRDRAVSPNGRAGSCQAVLDRAEDSVKPSLYSSVYNERERMNVECRIWLDHGGGGKAFGKGPASY